MINPDIAEHLLHYNRFLVQILSGVYLFLSYQLMFLNLPCVTTSQFSMVFYYFSSVSLTNSSVSTEIFTRLFGFRLFKRHAVPTRQEVHHLPLFVRGNISTYYLTITPLQYLPISLPTDKSFHYQNISVKCGYKFESCLPSYLQTFQFPNCRQQQTLSPLSFSSQLHFDAPSAVLNAPQKLPVFASEND